MYLHSLSRNIWNILWAEYLLHMFLKFYVMSSSNFLTTFCMHWLLPTEHLYWYISLKIIKFIKQFNALILFVLVFVTGTKLLLDTQINWKHQLVKKKKNMIRNKSLNSTLQFYYIAKHGCHGNRAETKISITFCRIWN